MRIVIISNKTALVRHWFKWYRVQRGGTDWQPLEVKKRPAPVNIGRIAKGLQAKYGTPALPAILDEKAADAQVAMNLPKQGIDKKAKA